MIFSLYLAYFLVNIGRLHAQADNIPVKGYTLVWQDEFNGNSLDKTKWDYRNTGKRRDAYNSRETVKIDNGKLVIEVKRKKDSLLMGMIGTQGLFETRYGYFECKASLTNTRGVWPAFWLQSPYNTDNSNPQDHGAEIDIFEYFLHEGKDSVSHTLHWGGYGATYKKFGPFYSPLKKTSDGFHTFGLEWTPDSYTTFVDGVPTHTGNRYISKVPQYMILSLEAEAKVAGPLEERKLPDRFVIDYVRVYKKVKNQN